jgi:hypothetical protein
MNQSQNQRPSQIYHGPVASVRIGLKYQSIFCHLVYKVSEKINSNILDKELVDDLVYSLWLENSIISEFASKITHSNTIDLDNITFVITDLELSEKDTNIKSNSLLVNKQNQELSKNLKNLLIFLEEKAPQLFTQLKQNITIFEKIRKNNQDSKHKKAKELDQEKLQEIITECQKLEEKYPKTQRAVYLVGPTVLDQEKSFLDLVISGNGHEIMMVECGANLIEESIINEAIDLASLEIRKLIKIQKDFFNMVATD